MMNVPESTLNEIESKCNSDDKRKMELFGVCATKNPELTWEQLFDALYRMRDEQCHKTLDILQSKFPTGESPSLLIPHPFPILSPVVYCNISSFLPLSSFITSATQMTAEIKQHKHALGM